MDYTESKMNLFDSAGSYALVHCISSDFVMGAGIAKSFSEFRVKKELMENYPVNIWHENGYCLHTTAGTMAEKFPNGVYNLITKEHFYYKPTMTTLLQALEDLKNQCVEDGVCKLAMPTIGCGLDKLKWEEVAPMVRDVFKDTDIEISVAVFEKINRKETIKYCRE